MKIQTMPCTLFTQISQRYFVKMKCLHGEPAATSTTKNGSFWFCGQKPSCNFFCSEDEGYLFEKAINVWRFTDQPQPQCDVHHKPARMRVVKDMMKESFGRPFFVCSDKNSPCSFWMWGDVSKATRPSCRHGFPCSMRKVKKEGLNKDRMFFCCPNEKDKSCRYFEWAPDTEPMNSHQTVNMAPAYNYSLGIGNEMANELTNSFQSMTLC